MERTDEIKKYLKNKHQGGENNQKGGLFEDFYAVYQIVSCIDRYKSSLDSVKFQTQLEDTFVDDMLIVLPEWNIYHQLKNTKVLSWGKVDKQGDIAFDFAHLIRDGKVGLHVVNDCVLATARVDEMPKGERRQQAVLHLRQTDYQTIMEDPEARDMCSGNE